MTTHKIVRTLCLFRAVPDPTIVETLAALAQKLTEAGYLVQTQRLCTATTEIDRVERVVGNRDIVLSVGTLSPQQAYEQLQHLYAAGDVSFNIDRQKRTCDIQQEALIP